MTSKPKPAQPAKSREVGTRFGKAVELLVLGMLVGAFSVALSFLWKGYVHKASDLVQYFTAEPPPFFIQYLATLPIPFFSHITTPNRLPFRIVLIDVGEQTCKQWAKKDYAGMCAGLPRLPHAELSKIFQRLKTARPKLLVIDVDLRTEKAGSNPFDPDVNSFTAEEIDFRTAINDMANTPVLVAQPLIRQPEEGQRQYYDYKLVGTILHKLEKSNLRFGQVEESPGDDGVLRRFVATVKPAHSDSILNPNADETGAVPHLALRVCELLRDKEFCGRQHASNAKYGDCPATKLRFGSLQVCPNQLVQFRYMLARDVSRLIESGVEVIEARSIMAPSFHPSILDDALIIFGSTARGRGDYHVTPLDVFGGETSGLVVVANEVAAALDDRWLASPPAWMVILEKFFLIILSMVIIFFGFWYSYFGKSHPSGAGLVRRLLSSGVTAIHFILIVLLAILANAAFIWFVSVYSFRNGELVDPVTPVIAAFLDILVDLCAMIKDKAALWADRWYNLVARSS